MRTPILFGTILFALSVNTVGCSTSRLHVRPEGEQARITMTKGHVIEAEVIAVADTALLVNVTSGAVIAVADNALQVNVTSGSALLRLHDGERMVGIAWDSIQMIEILGYSNSNWLVPWLFFQALPPVLIGIAAASYGVDGGEVFLYMFSFSLPGILSGVLLSAGSKKNPVYKEFHYPGLRDQLRRYSRYPIGLNTDQINVLTRSMGQDGWRVLRLPYD